MKIVIDRDLNLTRGDYAGNIARGADPDIKVSIPNDAIITHTPADLFSKYGFDLIEAERPKDVGAADHQYRDLRDRLLSDEELKKKIDQKFLMALKSHFSDFDQILLQKVTYKLDINEDLNEIEKTIKSMDSNALFRAYTIDRENGTVTTFSSREGIWFVDDQFMPKSSELRSAGKIRTDRALRSVKDPSKKVDTKRLNYPLFEETYSLLENGSISHSYATREQPDGSYKDDTPTVYVTKLHYKNKLEEEEIRQQQTKQEAAAVIKKETTHVNKPQATKEQSDKSIEKNKKEIHTKHDPLRLTKEKEIPKELQENREDALKNYAQKLFDDLENRQKTEREELKQKLDAALGEERIKAKQTFVTSLANGMTVMEAIDNLRAAKHNEILVQATLEEVKSDMIMAVKKDEIIAEKLKELEKTAKELESTSKKLETEAKANKTNHENYIKELNKRKEAEVAIGKLKSIAEKLNDSYHAAKAQNLEMKEEITQKDHELEDKDSELESQFSQIEELKHELEDKVRLIEKLKISMQENEVKFAKLETRIEEVEKFNKKLESINSSFGDRIEILHQENRAIQKEISQKKEEEIENRISSLKSLDLESDEGKYSDGSLDQE